MTSPCMQSIMALGFSMYFLHNPVIELLVSAAIPEVTVCKKKENIE